jgi:hypothetical protein
LPRLPPGCLAPSALAPLCAQATLAALIRAVGPRLLKLDHPDRWRILGPEQHSHRADAGDECGRVGGHRAAVCECGLMIVAIVGGHATITVTTRGEPSMSHT